jgi:ABC-type transport system involved in cytochrome c biogenesis permease subunit
MMKPLHLLLLLCSALLVSCGSDPLDPKKLKLDDLPPTWDPATMKKWEAVPIMDGGRVKPLYTFARYELLRPRGMTSVSVQLTEKHPTTGKDTLPMDAMQFFMDSLWNPTAAGKYFVFTVEDGTILPQIGMTAHGKRRDQYSYNELVLHRAELAKVQSEVSKRESDAKDAGQKIEIPPHENALVALAENVSAFETTIHSLDLVRRGIPLATNLPDGGPLSASKGTTVGVLQALDALKANPSWKEMMEMSKTQNMTAEDLIQEMAQRLTMSPAYKSQGPKDITDDMGVLKGIEAWITENKEGLIGHPGLAEVMNMTPYLMLGMNIGDRMKFIPPLSGEDKGWHSPNELPKLILLDSPYAAKARELLEKFESIRTANDNTARQSALKGLAETLIASAESSGVYSKIGTELSYQKAALFDRTKMICLTMFLLTAFSWLGVGKRWGQVVHSIAKWGIVVAALLITWNIGWRVYVAGWAPVTTLYETIPLVALTGLALCIVGQKVFRNSIPTAVAGIFGFMGMMMVGMFEAAEKTDQFRSLEAVLRSGFWLWTHVIAEVIAYGSAFVGAFFSVVYVFLRVFDIQRRRAAVAKSLTTFSYGILCFTLFFILVGTILGGIWGNYSWGRFWGWDPKENGALVITLACLVVLHMRLAGWVKEFGLHIMNILILNAVIFSWWHVNELSVGLHTYGKSEGRMDAMIIGYGIVNFIALCGVVTSLVAKMDANARRMAAKSGATSPDSLPQAG